MKTRRVSLITAACVVFAAGLACQAASGVVPAASPTSPQPPTQVNVPPTPPQPTPTDAPLMPVLEDSDATARIINSGDVDTLSDLKHESGQDETFKPDVERYTVDMAPDTQIDLGPGWCTKTASIRDENKKHFDPTVDINDHVIPDSQLAYLEWKSDDGMYCFSWDIVASDWPVGKYVVREGFTFDAPLNDGWDNYAAGDYTSEFTVTVTEGAGAPSGSASSGDQCLMWNEVTTDMKGETACVRGIIDHITQSNKNTRYRFSAASKSFFLFTSFWEIYNTNTGKSWAPGTCVEATGLIEIQSDIPFINIDKLEDTGDGIHGLEAYKDTGPCE